MFPLRREVHLSRGVWILFGLALTGLVLHGLRAVLTPIFLAFLIAYVLDPLVDRLERRRIPRALGILIVLFVLLSAVIAFFTFLIPSILRDIVSFARELPSHVHDLLHRAEPLLSRYNISVPHSFSEAADALSGRTEEVASKVLAPLGSLLTQVIGGTVSVLGTVAAALLVPVMAFYLLYDFDKIIDGVHDLVPLKWRDPVGQVAKEVDFVLGQFMRGQVTVMAILAVLYGGAYAAMGVRLAIPIGMMAGILNFIPYVGSAFALIAGLLMSLLGGFNPMQLLGVVLCYAVVQTLEGFVITPKIVGKTVGLSDIWVLIALFLAGELFGFLGVLLAVPAAAVLKIFIVRGLRHYHSTSFYLESEPAPGSFWAGFLAQNDTPREPAPPAPPETKETAQAPDSGAAKEEKEDEEEAAPQANSTVEEAPPDIKATPPQPLAEAKNNVPHANPEESKDNPKEIEPPA